MSKNILSKTQDGQFVWIVSPDVILNSFIKSKKFNFLDLFYYFGQKLVDKNDLLSLSKKKMILIELQNKVVQIKFYSKELKKSANNLLSRNLYNRKIYNYKKSQIFLGLLEGFLNTLHSIKDFTKKIDESLNCKIINKLQNQEWFKIDMCVRTLLQHIESPVLYIDNNDICLIFDRVDDLEHKEYKNMLIESKDENGRVKFSLGSDDLSKNILDFLNSWAKEYIDILIEKYPDESIDLINGFQKDGRFKTINKKLKNLISIINK